MFDFLKRLFDKSRFQEAIVSPYYGYNSLYGKSTPENFSNLLKGYSTEVYVYACIYIISTTIAGLPYLIYKKDAKGEKVPIKNQVLDELLEFPNSNDENSTWYNLIEWTVANLELTGNAYWLLDKLYKGDKLPGAIQVMLSDKMRVIPNTDMRSDDFVKGYVYLKDDGIKVPFTDNEIVHFKYIKPDNYYYGQGSVTPSSVSIDLIREAEKTNLRMFLNGAMPGGILESEKPLTDERIDRLRKQLYSKYGGSENAHKWIITDNGLKFKDITKNMKDLEFIEGIKLSRENVCAAFGVPPVLVGILDKATYSNYEQAVKIFWVHTLIPKLKRLEQVITHIVRRFEPKAYFGFDTSNIEALKENQGIVADIAQKYFNMGVPMNEIIQVLNLPFKPIEGGDVGYMPFSLMPVGTERRQETPEPVEEEEEEEEPKGKSIDKSWLIKKEYLYKRFDRLTRSIESKYRLAIDKFFSSLGAEVERNLNGRKSISKSAEDYLFDRDEAIKEWARQSGKFHKLGFSHNGKLAIEDVGLSQISFNLANPRAQKWLEKFALQEAKLTVGTFKDDLKAELVEGFELGESIRDLTNRVSEQTGYYGADKYKAERIARTEVIASSNAGSLEAWKQSGLKIGKCWLFTNDGRQRDTHEEAGMFYNENKPIPLDEDFQVGGGKGPAPCQIDDPGESINCRCTMFSQRITE